MNLVGKIEQILEAETGVSKSDKKWIKQSIVINNGDAYNPQTCISFFGEDKVKMLKDFKVGEDVEVSINLSSREHEGRWYNSIDGWKITANTDFNLIKEEVKAKETDDLPF